MEISIFMFGKKYCSKMKQIRAVNIAVMTRKY